MKPSCSLSEQLTIQQDGRDSLGSESSSKISDDVDSSMVLELNTGNELVMVKTQCSEYVTSESKTTNANTRTDVCSKEATNGICDNVRFDGFIFTMFWAVCMVDLQFFEISCLELELFLKFINVD